MLMKIKMSKVRLDVRVFVSVMEKEGAMRLVVCVKELQELVN